MIFQRIDFHNIEQMEPFEDGWRMWRLPLQVRGCLNQGIQTTSGCYATGVELRFRLVDDCVRIRLRALPIAEAQVAFLYHGSFQAGWETSSHVISTDGTTLTIRRPANMALMQEIARTQHLPFSPEVVRIVLPYGTLLFQGVEGEVEPPRPEDLPRKTYLAYGSSITHGSLALATPHTYPFRIAQQLGCDYLNLGFAGTAHLEREMAEYIVSRRDWDFASVELGVNMLSDAFPPEKFEERVDAFTAVLAADPRPVFATSIFGFNGGRQEQARIFRDIVHRYAGARLHFIDGLQLLNNPAYISQDMVHPSLEGANQIAQRWAELMRHTLPQD